MTELVELHMLMNYIQYIHHRLIIMAKSCIKPCRQTESAKTFLICFAFDTSVHLSIYILEYITMFYNSSEPTDVTCSTQ